MTGSTLPQLDTDARAPRREAATFPWPPTDPGSTIGAFFRTWRASVFEPRAFFRSLPVQGQTGPALVYYAILGMAVATLEFFWQITFALAIDAAAQVLGVVEWLGLRVDAVSPVVAFLLAPFMLAVTLVMTFAIVHVLLWLLGGARHGPATTLRVLCYAYSPRAFGIVPMIGGWIGFAWMLVTAIVGLREAHGTDGWRAALAILLPFALLVMAAMALAILLALVIGIAA